MSVNWPGIIKEIGLSDTQIADRVGADRTHIFRIRKDQVGPGYELGTALMNLLKEQRLEQAFMEQQNA